MDHKITPSAAIEAVRKELQGPGALLGYRAMALKVRQKYNLNIQRDAVHNIMYSLDPDGLAKRKPGTKKKKERGHFVTLGPNWTHSLDGHDKLMGYQNWTFPLAIYGCIDTASRKILWLKVWNTNAEPKLVGKWYLEYLMDSKMLPHYIRIDKGTETTTLTTIHAYLRSLQGDLVNATDSVIFGPSTSNQVRIYI